MKKLVGIFLVFSLLSIGSLHADEGMWLPVLLKKLNVKDMKEKGLTLSADDIYSVNKACLKDAIVKFGRGCTGELISDQGLLITNHHCGFGSIQKHSSVEHDYLTDGFWAMNRAEELPNAGLSVTFMVRMEDVSKKVLKGTDKATTEDERNKIIKENIETVKAKAVERTHYKAMVESFYYGNEYYLFVNEVFKDVRLVGAPPSSIGKFGGDTDNWMWPRHTGDFSVFRIYANKENKPAEYADDNVPYKPKQHFAISLKGIEEGDFTMVFGYPARTNEYLTSQALKLDINTHLPHKIALRTTRLNIMNQYQAKDRGVRIQYASKNARAANAWKKWQGIIKGLNRQNAIEKKLATEVQFENWANSDKKLKAEYGGLVTEINQTYFDLKKYILAKAYRREAAMAVEVLNHAYKYRKLVKAVEEDKSQEDIQKIVDGLVKTNSTFFKDYYQPIDQEIFIELMTAYSQNVNPDFHPEIYTYVNETHKGCFKSFAKEVYENSLFCNKDDLTKLLGNFTAENAAMIKEDIAFKTIMSYNRVYNEMVKEAISQIEDKQALLYRKYMNGLREMQSDKVFYPDANFTLRLSYGEVKDYEGADAVIYDYQTTLEGIMQKDNPEIYDYDIPQRLRDVYAEKDYGQYNLNGTVPVAFVATNHTSGGNSGSPVINANGELIGVNFDRCWEGTMSDYMFDPNYCRNISLDIRYALFVIEKVGGAKHLIDEMTIVK